MNGCMFYCMIEPVYSSQSYPDYKVYNCVVMTICHVYNYYLFPQQVHGSYCLLCRIPPIVFFRWNLLSIRYCCKTENKNYHTVGTVLKSRKTKNTTVRTVLKSRKTKNTTVRTVLKSRKTKNTTQSEQFLNLKNKKYHTVGTVLKPEKQKIPHSQNSS